MRHVCLILFLILSCSFQSAMAAGDISVQGPPLAHRLNFTEIENEKLLVSVVDANDEPLLGLTKDDFKIVKENRTAKVVDVMPLETSEEVGLNVVLVVDNSASMKQRKAIGPLLEALEAFFGTLRPIDNVAIVVYDDHETQKVGDRQVHAKSFQSNRVDALHIHVREQMDSGLTSGTYLYEAMLLGLDVARKWPAKSNKFMVVFSDGDDINSEIDTETVTEAARDIPNFSGYTVDYMPTDSLDPFLGAFAADHDGRAWKARSATELLPIFEAFSSTLLHRYVVSYRFLNAPTGEIAFQTDSIAIEEVSTIDSAPLLNYIFFEAGRSDIPPKYVQLEGRAETDAFSEKSLVSVMEKYTNIMNIIGYRMRVYPDATITIVGCNADRGEEKGRQDLSRSRAESVKAYLRYVWGIASDRMTVEARNLPQAPSTSRIPEGQAENRRVEIHSDHARMLDTVRSEYAEQLCDRQNVRVIPKIDAEAGVRDWSMTLTCNGEVIGEQSGTGDLPAMCEFPLEKQIYDTLVKAGNIKAGLRVTDTEGQTLVLEDAAELPVQYIQRKQLLAKKQGYKVREKYALILFDYDSDAIKSRNKTIVDRITARIEAIPEPTVRIVGHTDNIGKDAYNIKLSQKRAEAVKAQFSPDQLSSVLSNLTVIGQGPYNALYDNGTPEGRSLNRTVTISLEYEQK